MPTTGSELCGAVSNQPYNAIRTCIPANSRWWRIIGQGRWQHPFHEHAITWSAARDGNLLAEPPRRERKLCLPVRSSHHDDDTGHDQDGIFYWTGRGSIGMCSSWLKRRQQRLHTRRQRNYTSARPRRTTTNGAATTTRRLEKHPPAGGRRRTVTLPDPTSFQEPGTAAALTSERKPPFAPWAARQFHRGHRRELAEREAGFRLHVANSHNEREIRRPNIPGRHDDDDARRST